ncbi:kama family protein [Polyplosphaeria fusca]|uniref:Kama family protein n=1 Tax=Polyplosphaeria fusca TaxID=682080 RepID=A0A9P4QSB2_9PLEO|nr:kama family protein [Polyplosphaeria fusca]
MLPLVLHRFLHRSWRLGCFKRSGTLSTAYLSRNFATTRITKLSIRQESTQTSNTFLAGSLKIGIRPFLKGYWAGIDQKLDVPKLPWNQPSLLDAASRKRNSRPSACRHFSSSSLIPGRERYWQKIPQWENVTTEEFTSYRWQLKFSVVGDNKLKRFLAEALPEKLPSSSDPRLAHIATRELFIQDVEAGVTAAPMAIRLTPYILSSINWGSPLDDPVRKQFIPLRSSLLPDHEALTLDSLHEEHDSPVPGLVHRYPDKALFLVTSICPVYCRFCTRSYAVGAPTETLDKKKHQKPSRRRWEVVFQYIESTPTLQDIVVSGGDTYFLQPEDITEIGERLLSIPHVKRFRFASKGLSVLPGRVTDTNDRWFSTFIDLSNRGRREGKHICLHTHFNHPNEITWITREAARHLFSNGVIVRNQSVLLRGVNDTVETMGTLIRELSDMNIRPYYVYQCDLVRGIEDLRTPLSTILELEQQLRGTIAGFMMPSFVVDLPGGGGKRLACSYHKYENGTSHFRAPGLLGEKGEREYKYFDPVTTNHVQQVQRHDSVCRENARSQSAGLVPDTDGPMAGNDEELIEPLAAAHGS